MNYWKGPLTDTDCLLDKSVCNGRRCILGGAIRELNHQIRQTLAKHTLAELTPLLSTGVRHTGRQSAHQPVSLKIHHPAKKHHLGS